MQKTTVRIAGMHCRSCELLIEEDLLKVPGVEKARTDFRKGIAEISYKGQKPDDAVIEEAIRNAGYTIGREKQPWFSQDIIAWVEALFALGAVFILFFGVRSLGLFEISLGSSGAQLSSLPFVLLFGAVAGLSTCMAMVGGLVLAAASRYSETHPEASVRKRFSPHLYFNLGRIGGFAVLGASLGALGSAFQLSPFSIGMLTALVGGVMLLLGLQLLGLFPRLSGWKLTLPKGIARMFGLQSRAKREYGHGRVMFLGAMTFFLPCGFTQLAQLFVVTTGSPVTGALTMGVFALGTAPGLLGIGGVAAAAQGWFRRFFFKAAGIAAIALGIFNVQNGVALVRIGAENPAGNGSIVQKAVGPVSSEDVQVIRVTQDASGYFPNQLTIKKGRPVRLIVDSEDPYICAASFMIPKFGVQKVLTAGENVFEFTPDQAGQIPFSCSMGMYRGVIDVAD